MVLKATILYVKQCFPLQYYNYKLITLITEGSLQQPFNIYVYRLFKQVEHPIDPTACRFSTTPSPPPPPPEISPPPSQACRVKSHRRQCKHTFQAHVYNHLNTSFTSCDTHANIQREVNVSRPQEKISDLEQLWSNANSKVPLILFSSQSVTFGSELLC